MSAIDEFSSRLKLLRKEKNLQQGELAKELGVSRGSVSFYENGDRVPDIEFLSKASKYFGVSADWLLGLAHEKTADMDMRSACEFTGLAEDSINNLKCLSSQDLKWVNLLISSLFLSVFSDEAEHLNEAKKYLCSEINGFGTLQKAALQKGIIDSDQSIVDDDALMDAWKDFRYNRFEIFDDFKAFIDWIFEYTKLSEKVYCTMAKLQVEMESEE